MKVKHIFAIGEILLGGFLVAQGASATVTYQASTNVQFTFNPELSLSLSSADFVINGLIPGTSKNSNVVTATVSTNSVAGYTLSATVGDGSTYTTTDLISTGNNTIEMMTSGNTLTAGTWGYTLDGGTTYGALDTANSTILKKTTAVGGGTTDIQIGAYAAANQAEGEYNNVMNFAAVANPMPPIYSISTMQAFASMTAAQKAEVVDTMEEERTYTITDARDGQSYQIAKLADGNVWMTTNLNLGAVSLATDLTSSNTNLSTTISAADFNSYKKTSGSASFTAAEYISVSGNDTSVGGPGTPYGTLYNYCAASAGTICTDSNVANATYDICPAGWRLPTGGTGGEFDILYNNPAYGTYEKMRAPVSEGGAAFAFTGYFWDGAWYIHATYPNGTYWSSTAYPDYYEGPDISGYIGVYMASLSSRRSAFYSDALDERDFGYAVRCILR